MVNKKTIKMCHDEIVRLVRILCYQKIDKKDMELIIKSLKFEVEDIGRIEHQKMLLQEARRAEKEREKYGARGRYGK